MTDIIWIILLSGIVVGCGYCIFKHEKRKLEEDRKKEEAFWKYITEQFVAKVKAENDLDQYKKFYSSIRQTENLSIKENDKREN